MTVHPSDLGPEDLGALADWRRALHRRPELSGAEAETAAAVARMLAAQGPDRIWTGLGGHGVAATWAGAAPGPAILVRAELDALPIAEESSVPHVSEFSGRAHLCGHDGHMAILAGLARRLGRVRPASGRAILLFQPAEETGAGAAAVLADPRFAEIAPDMAVALHNLPGLPRGAVRVAPGPACCASRGMRIRLRGREAHASSPETGLSPAPALSRLLQELPALCAGAGPADPGFRMVTLTHARMGAPAFGISPGRAELFATLRTRDDDAMQTLVDEARALAEAAAAGHGLVLDVGWEDVFAACVNAREPARALARGAAAAGLSVSDDGLPMRFSEDFGRFGAAAPGALLLLGAGADQPPLHDAGYDFPDALIAEGVALFSEVLDDLLGRADGG
ncbi:amidohydrolase [Rhodosalinus sp. 5P4]|uniref:amidohydrolase n=1 Tax=Rhodosalinus sp. 5P4 TaxID=3239196 RepID=UPI0035245D63